MRSDIERAIRQFYPSGEFLHPFKEAQIKKTTHQRQQMYEVIGLLRSKVDRNLGHVACDDKALSETILFCDGAIILNLSFLGPFAYLNLSRSKTIVEAQKTLYVSHVQLVLEKYEVLLLNQSQFDENVPWLSRVQKVTAGDCLFGKGES